MFLAGGPQQQWQKLLPGQGFICYFAAGASSAISGPITEKKTRKTKEADFLVIIEGNIGILECDGKAYHQTAAEDHQRDRNFQRQGIRFIQRYSYEECLQEYQVVDDFIALMRKHFSL